MVFPKWRATDLFKNDILNDFLMQTPSEMAPHECRTTSKSALNGVPELTADQDRLNRVKNPSRNMGIEMGQE